MKLTKIEFNGYKRLLGTACNVDSRTIAFIGPNESGKSSVLHGLSWLTDPDRRSLSANEQSRKQSPSKGTHVVRAFFRLDDDDIELLRSLKLDVSLEIDRKTVTEFRYSRTKDGSFRTGIDTTVTRNMKPFQSAHKALEAIEVALTSALDLLIEHEIEGTAALIRTAKSSVDPQNTNWDGDRVQQVRDTADELQLLLDRSRLITQRSAALTKLRKNIEKALPLLSAAADAGSLEDPEEAFRTALVERVPRFILFTDDQREISERYALHEDGLREDPPAPLRNLLRVAGTSVHEVWRTISSGETSVMRTLERRLNHTLQTRLQPMWTQSKITIAIALNIDGTLEVNILEVDSPELTVTPIAERSDGLRTFLGLICFLIAAELELPPVLMIDEAERNLHYDAQADLIRVLTRELHVHKIIYTTHSPGCLPLDLGTGIRVVARNPDDPAVSVLRNTFWTSNEPGFSHLLFAMGAEAAAFSAFRRAVLAEGVSEMILLPTLLRNATDGSQLDFQVAFGLSNTSAPQSIGTVALITAFLVDGDRSGNHKRQQLLDAGIPSSHIFQLPAGKAIEDLVDRTLYLKVVNDFLAEQGRFIPPGQLPKQGTIASAVDSYAKARLGLEDGVSHKIIASRLAELGDDLKPSQHGRQYLADLRSKLEAAFSQTYMLK